MNKTQSIFCTFSHSKHPLSAPLTRPPPLSSYEHTCPSTSIQHLNSHPSLANAPPPPASPPSVMNKFTAHYSGLDLWQNNAGTNNLVCQHLSAASSITVRALNLNGKVHLTAGPLSDYPPRLCQLLQTDRPCSDC